ncbi:hypothetical protein OsccyDRAFT_4895 [Leptolyngbyaceae cyanobacterium JSC-12]|nr:hypothetical protein OsccyDRAFT_4895 [Leptolyngbyaceae cyanobacterium JSC-12]
MPEPSERKRIYINALPEYEMKLLTALSFFLGRKVSTQAAAALAMYIRQSHDRILSQTEYYAHRAGMNKWDFLDLIFENPQKAEELMKGTGAKIHTGEPDIFTETELTEIDKDE